MITSSYTIILGILSFLCVLLTILIINVSRKKGKKQLDKVFIISSGLLIFWMLGLICQIIGVNIYNINPIYFDYFVYIHTCFLPVAFLFMALIFARTKINT